MRLRIADFNFQETFRDTVHFLDLLFQESCARLWVVTGVMGGSVAYTLFAAAETRLVEHAAACEGRNCGGHGTSREVCCGRDDGESQAAASVSRAADVTDRGSVLSSCISTGRHHDVVQTLNEPFLLIYSICCSCPYLRKCIMTRN